MLLCPARLPPALLPVASPLLESEHCCVLWCRQGSCDCRLAPNPQGSFLRQQHWCICVTSSPEHPWGQPGQASVSGRERCKGCVLNSPVVPTSCICPCLTSMDWDLPSAWRLGVGDRPPWDDMAGMSPHPQLGRWRRLRDATELLITLDAWVWVLPAAPLGMWFKHVCLCPGLVSCFVPVLGRAIGITKAASSKERARRGRENAARPCRCSGLGDGRGQ